MKKNGKYRFTLQFGMNSEQEIRAGEILEKMGNKKSKFLIAAINEYSSNHPELNIGHDNRSHNMVSFPMNLLEIKIREILKHDIPASETTEPKPIATCSDMYKLDFIRYQENRFDSFCKTVIRNASLDSIRSRKKREALFSSLDDLQSDLYLQEISQDRYATYSMRYRVKGIDVTIENEEIGEALQYILPN